MVAKSAAGAAASDLDGDEPGRRGRPSRRAATLVVAITLAASACGEKLGPAPPPKGPGPGDDQTCTFGTCTLTPSGGLGTGGACRVTYGKATVSRGVTVVWNPPNATPDFTFAFDNNGVVMDAGQTAFEPPVTASDGQSVQTTAKTISATQTVTYTFNLSRTRVAGGDQPVKCEPVGANPIIVNVTGN